MKRTLTMLALMLPMIAFAQWRVGVNCGADMNHFIIDKQYQTDYQYKNRWLLPPVSFTIRVCKESQACSTYHMTKM